CCGIVGETLMARVGPENFQTCLQSPHAREMDFTGKPMKGMIYVDPAGIEADSDLSRWVDICTNFISTLPPKKPK
ncbi:MAG: RNA methyltransferase, partial [Nitrospinota bacterium]